MCDFQRDPLFFPFESLRFIASLNDSLIKWKTDPYFDQPPFQCIFKGKIADQNLKILHVNPGPSCLLLFILFC